MKSILRSLRNYLNGIRSAFNLFPPPRNPYIGKCVGDGFAQDMKNLRKDFNKALNALGHVTTDQTSNNK